MQERTIRPEDLLRAVAGRQLTTPILLWLAGHRPLAFFAGQTLLTAAPLAALLGWPDVNAWAVRLSEPDAVPRLEEMLLRQPQDGIEPHGLE